MFFEILNLKFLSNKSKLYKIYIKGKKKIESELDILKIMNQDEINIIKRYKVLERRSDFQDFLMSDRLNA